MSKKTAFLMGGQVSVKSPFVGLFYLTSGGSKERPSPTAQNVLNLTQFFGKRGKIVCWRPPPPPPPTPAGNPGFAPVYWIKNSTWPHRKLSFD